MARNLNAVKTFFDPHPGLAGAIVPIPEAVKKVANNLNGKSMTLREAVARIKAVTKGTVRVVDRFEFIYLEHTESNGVQHGFRVIRFK